MEKLLLERVMLRKELRLGNLCSSLSVGGDLPQCALLLVLPPSSQPADAERQPGGHPRLLAGGDRGERHQRVQGEDGAGGRGARQEEEQPEKEEVMILCSISERVLYFYILFC